MNATCALAPYFFAFSAKNSRKLAKILAFKQTEVGEKWCLIKTIIFLHKQIPYLYRRNNLDTKKNIFNLREISI